MLWIFWNMDYHIWAGFRLTADFYNSRMLISLRLTGDCRALSVTYTFKNAKMDPISFLNLFLMDLFISRNFHKLCYSQGVRRHWFVNFTGTQSFMIKIFGYFQEFWLVGSKLVVFKIFYQSKFDQQTCDNFILVICNN